MNKRSYKITLDIFRLYLDSDLPEELVKETKSWLISDFRMSEKRAVLRMIWDSLYTVRDRKAEKRAWKAIMKETGLKQTQKLMPAWRVIVWSAAVMIPVFLTVAFYYTGMIRQQGQPQVIYVERTKVITGNEKKQLLLPDGTNVWLNERSEFTYGADRRTQLKGEAYFEVVKMKEPFTVETECITLTVTGTSFNIQAYPEATNKVVTLYEGTLELATPDTMVLVSPGEEWTVNSEMNTFDLVSTRQTTPVWRREYISYENVELQEIFRDLEKSYPIRIRGSRPDVMNDILTLKFEKDTDLEDILFLLSQLNGKFDYTIENDTVNIY